MGSLNVIAHKAQTIVQTPVSKGRIQAAVPQVSSLILEVISQCKRRGGMSMQELKQALAAGGYDVTKNNARVNLAMQSLVRKETIVQTAGQGTSDSFKINKVIAKPTAEKSGRIRAKRKMDAEKKSASKRPKPARKHNKAGQKQQLKRATTAVLSPKMVKKDVKAQAQARKNAKDTQKAVTNTKRKSQRKVVHSR
uniref:H15 domain-containing protein n=1 Tax=Pygocentrus nattereri TaxID=42514 RepID=A0A3B4CPM0_PYGNA